MLKIPEMGERTQNWETLIKEISKETLHFTVTGILSWDTPEIYSFYLTSTKLYYQPTAQDFAPHALEFNKNQSYIIEEGALSKLLKIRFIKIIIIEEDATKFSFYMLPKKDSYDSRYRWARTKLQRIYDKVRDENDQSENSLSGSILLWDFDNIKFNDNEKKTGKIIDFLKRLIQDEYGPLHNGYTVHQSTYSDKTLQYLQRISKKIIAGRAPSQKDAADKLLVEKAKEWLEFYRPEYMIIISGDHIFTELSKLTDTIGTKVILIHNQANASKTWLSAGTFVKGYNLSDITNNSSESSKIKPSNVIRCSICNKQVKSLEGLTRHREVKHNMVECPGCTKKFGDLQAVKQHQSATGH